MYVNGGPTNGQMPVKSVDSISGRSAALYFAHDPSVAHLLLNFGIRVRDFILVSFLSDQGPLTVEQLARVLNIDPLDLLKSVKRLAAAGLVVRDPISPESDFESLVRLTDCGEDMASRVDKQL